MKITGIESVVLNIPTRKPMALELPEHRMVVATIATDEGLTGLGYSLAFGGGGAEAIQVYLETRLKPLLLGEDPLFVERLGGRVVGAAFLIELAFLKGRERLKGYPLQSLIVYD